MALPKKKRKMLKVIPSYRTYQGPNVADFSSLYRTNNLAFFFFLKGSHESALAINPYNKHFVWLMAKKLILGMGTFLLLFKINKKRSTVTFLLFLPFYGPVDFGATSSHTLEGTQHL